MLNPATISRQAAIVAVFASRLRTIKRARGFASDVGDHLDVGFVRMLGPDDPDEAMALTIGDSEPTIAGPAYIVQLPIQIHAIAKYTVEDAWMRIEQIVADIRRAVEVADRRLGGLSGEVERGPQVNYEPSPGSLAIGLTLTYQVPFKDAWGGVV